MGDAFFKSFACFVFLFLRIKEHKVASSDTWPLVLLCLFLLSMTIDTFDICFLICIHTKHHASIKIYTIGYVCIVFYRR